MRTIFFMAQASATLNQELVRIKERLDKLEEVVDGMKESFRSWKLRLEFVEGSLQARYLRCRCTDLRVCAKKFVCYMFGAPAATACRDPVGVSQLSRLSVRHAVPGPFGTCPDRQRVDQGPEGHEAAGEIAVGTVRAGQYSLAQAKAAMPDDEAPYPKILSSLALRKRRGGSPASRSISLAMAAPCAHCIECSSRSCG